MRTLWLEHDAHPGQRIPVGDFKFNDEASALGTAMRKHKRLEELMRVGWKVRSLQKRQVLRRGNGQVVVEQASLL